MFNPESVIMIKKRKKRVRSLQLDMILLPIITQTISVRLLHDNEVLFIYYIQIRLHVQNSIMSQLRPVLTRTQTFTKDLIVFET